MTDHLKAYDQCFNELVALPPFVLNKTEKQGYLLNLFTILHQHHYASSEAYARLTSSDVPTNIEDFPYLAVRLFKTFKLLSIAESDIFRQLNSSGTSGQQPAQIYLDNATSARQSKVLVKIMQDFIGKRRLPMFIVDCPSTMTANGLSARKAGIQGMAFFGRKPEFLLNDDMSLNMETLAKMEQISEQQPTLIFGFTFMIWQYFIEALSAVNREVKCEKACLVHSGGWKKLVDKQVSNSTFKARLKQFAGISKVHNFYGMAEQVGSIFVECEHGHLHCPSMAEIIIRDPYTFDILPTGETGIIQVLSAIPTSYPGFSLLTEDMGQILGEDTCPCGRQGKYFRVQGRLPKAEIRGCSDVHAVNASRPVNG